MDNATPAIVYRYNTGLYVNLTNRCPTACVFCIKNIWKMDYRGKDLDLAGKEPSTDEILRLIKASWLEQPFNELVFCGYGEPTMRLDTLLSVAKALKSGKLAPVDKNIRVRLNTNGLGDLINNTDTVNLLKGWVDSVHVSLNALDRDKWQEMMRPARQYSENGYESVLRFIRNAARTLPETTITAIDGNVNAEKFSELAAELGAKARLRPKLEDEEAI